MDILIKSARIINPGGAHHGKTRDILIVNGKIKQVASAITNDEIPEGIKTVDAKKYFVSPGWMDLKVNFREPGEEEKEDLQSGLKAAAAGGFTAVLLMPSTSHPVQSKSDVEFIQSKTKNNLVDAYVSGCLTVDRKGNDMAELYDMHQSGAVAFTDDKKPVEDAGMLMRTLQYTGNFNSTVIIFPDDPSISHKQLINESITSASTGMKGSPALAEEIALSKAIRVCEYTKGKLHVSGISTAGSVKLIQQAKAKGIHITADVYAHHLMIDDTRLQSFDSNLKVKPPFRGKSDIAALKKGIAEGIIDAICSDHSPHQTEQKDVEYEYAAHGIIGLETTFAVAHTALNNSVDTETIIDKFVSGPRKILNLPAADIQVGDTANLTIFSTDTEWTFSEKDIVSKSKNTPFVGTKFTGKVIGVINNNKGFGI